MDFIDFSTFSAMCNQNVVNSWGLNFFYEYLEYYISGYSVHEASVSDSLRVHFFEYFLCACDKIFLNGWAGKFSMKKMKSDNKTRIIREILL